MTKCYFITGTDTGVGKTVASVALLQAAKQNGYKTAGYKPVSSGNTILFPKGKYNCDALLLQKNSSSLIDYQEVNLYSFSECTSPHIASNSECRPIDFSVLSSGLQHLKGKANWVLVEGAGGWFTPLSKYLTFADWVKVEKLSVILVVGIKLGCINHAILTAQAIMYANLHLAGWIANNLMPLEKRHVEFLITLNNFLSAPCLGEIPWFGKEVNYTDIGTYLNISLINSKNFS